MSLNTKTLIAKGMRVLGMEAFNHGFDFVLYPAAIAFLGIWKGGVLMIILSMILNYIFAHFYRNMGVGEIFIWIDNASSNPNWIGKSFRFFLRAGYWPTLAFLAWEDPTKAFIYARKGVSKKFSTKDWIVFVEVNVLGNLIHTLSWGGIIALIRAIVS